MEFIPFHKKKDTMSLQSLLLQDFYNALIDIVMIIIMPNDKPIP